MVPLPLTLPSALIGLSARTLLNPGSHRCFPRTLFFTTPPGITIDTMHEQNERLPLCYNGNNALMSGPDGRSKRIIRAYPRTKRIGDPLHDPALARHQARMLHHALKGAATRLSAIFYGKTNKPMFADDVDYQAWAQQRKMHLVEPAWLKHKDQQKENADFRRYHSDADVRGNYARDVNRRLERALRRAPIYGPKQKNHKKRLNRKTTQPPPMYLEALNYYGCFDDNDPLDIPLVADFRQWIIPNWVRSTGEHVPSVADMKPEPDDILPSPLNHYALYIRATLEVFNEHIRMCLLEAHHHYNTFPTRDYRGHGGAMGGLTGATKNGGFKDERFIAHCKSIAALIPANEDYPDFDLPMYGMILRALVTRHHPIIGAAGGRMKYDARDTIEAFHAYKGHGGAMQDMAIRFEEMQETELYQRLEKEVIDRYYAHAVALGIAPCDMPLGELLPLSATYRKEHKAYIEKWRKGVQTRAGKAHPAKAWQERYTKYIKEYHNVKKVQQDIKRRLGP